MAGVALNSSIGGRDKIVTNVSTPFAAKAISGRPVHVRPLRAEAGIVAKGRP